MHWLYLLILSSLLLGCAEDHSQNDPYVIEETELEHTQPGPYYEDEYD
jgi:hypothetical protein